MAHRAVFVAIESDGPRWTVKADTLTAGPEHSVDDTAVQSIRAAIVRLVHAHEVDADAYMGPIYFMMHSVSSEERARELAAALHAALHGDLEPLHRAVPPHVRLRADGARRSAPRRSRSSSPAGSPPLLALPGPGCTTAQQRARAVCVRHGPAA